MCNLIGIGEGCCVIDMCNLMGEWCENDEFLVLVCEENFVF